MAFVKCMLAGIAAVVGAVIAAALAMAAYSLWQARKFMNSGAGAIATPMLGLLPILCILMVIFAAGFWWQWRRAR
ncbi:MAG: hypothetical protein ABSF22_25050 [Bryobacteraceae bacterium]